MLTFFRRIRKTLLGSGATGKYLLYAIGEILLVLVGILLALQVNNWNERRKEGVEEIKTLIQLKESLDIEMADLDQNIGAINGILLSIEIILNHFDNDLPYHDSLDFHFGRSSMIMAFVVKPAVYENLKFTGLDLISNDSLRKDLVNYYDYQIPYLRDVERLLVQPHHNISVRPAMIDKFNYSGILSPATPTDYFKLKTDSRFRSLIQTTRETLGFQLRRSQISMEYAQKLRTNINAEVLTLSD